MHSIWSLSFTADHVLWLNSNANHVVSCLKTTNICPHLYIPWPIKMQCCRHGVNCGGQPDISTPLMPECLPQTDAETEKYTISEGKFILEDETQTISLVWKQTHSHIPLRGFQRLDSVSIARICCWDPHATSVYPYLVWSRFFQSRVFVPVFSVSFLSSGLVWRCWDYRLARMRAVYQFRLYQLMTLKTVAAGVLQDRINQSINQSINHDF